MEKQEQRLITKQRGDITIISFVDKRILEDIVIQQIGEQLFSMVEKEHKAKMLINFENVTYISSALLGKLIMLHKRILGENGQLKLCNLKENVFEVFRVTMLYKSFDIYDSEAAALSQFK